KQTCIKIQLFTLIYQESMIVLYQNNIYIYIYIYIYCTNLNNSPKSKLHIVLNVFNYMHIQRQKLKIIQKVKHTI
ncbi:MAG: hypothetical protein K6253_02890, partial [Candidatus Liberibacter asiaticus]|nr:hypothetical protein [Candidatus Liberibacter asiaticus]